MESLCWVYVIVQPAMPGLVKVGWSRKDPLSRAKELSGTHVPTDYVVAVRALVANADAVEKRAHRLLANRRRGKEWFECEVVEAITALNAACESPILFLQIHAGYATPKPKSVAPEPSKATASPRTPQDKPDIPLCGADQVVYPYSDGSYKCPYCSAWGKASEFNRVHRCGCGTYVNVRSPI